MPSPERSLFVRIIALGLAARAAAALLVPLTPEEAYHWTYARHLDLCYVDHPPLLAWVIAATTAVFGDTVIGIRAGPLLMGTLGTVWLCGLARRLYGERASRDAAVLLGVAPFFAAAGVLALPDSPLLAAWAWTLASAVRAVKERRSRDWLSAGVGAAFVVLSKFTGLLLFPSIGAALLLSREGRAALRRPAPWAALGIALLGLAPILVWNRDHGWSSYHFQVTRRAADFEPMRLAFLLRFAGQQALSVSPLIAGGIVWAAGRAVRPAWRSGEGAAALLLASAAVPFLAFAYASLRTETHIIWPAPAYLGALVLLGGALGAPAEAAPAYPRARTLLLRVTPALHGCLFALAVLHAAFVFPRVKPLKELYGWRELAAEVRRRVEGQRDAAGRPLFVVGFGRSFAVQSQLIFHLRDAVEVRGKEVVGYPGLQFTYWTDLDALAGRSAFVVADEPARYARALELAAPCFARLERLPPLSVPSAAGPLTFYAFRGDGYKAAYKPLPYYIPSPKGAGN